MSRNLQASSRNSKVVTSLRSRVQGLSIDGGTVIELRKTVLAGGFCVLPSCSLWRPPLWKLAVYVSSADSDCYKEREIIAQLLPLKKAKYAEHGIDIDIIDMRSGLRHDGEWDIDIWKYRKAEMERCRDESIGLCFMTLQGDKYGAALLAPSIAKSIFERLLTVRSEAEQKLLRTYYRLDTNSIPELYVLHVEVGYNYYSDEVQALLTLLDSVVFEEDVSDDLLVGRSISEWEIKNSFNVEHNKSRFYWFHRSIEPNLSVSADEAVYFEARGDEKKRDRLNALHNYLSRRFEPTTVSHFKPIKYDAIVAEDEQYTAYLNNFRHDMNELFHKALSQVIMKRSEWTLSGHGLGLPGNELSEILMHSMVAFELCKQFCGRDALVNSLVDQIITVAGPGDGDAAVGMDEFGHEAMPLENISMALVGDAGVGKSFLMSKLADEVYKKEMGSEFVIIRFCGLSADSSTGIGLMHSINTQVHFLLGRSYDKESFYSSYEETAQHFQSLMLDYAIVLFIDGVDFLQDENFARSQLSFLKGIKLHPSSRIVLSTRPDHHDPDTNKWVTYYGCDSRLRDNGVRRERVRRFQITTMADVATDMRCYSEEDADEKELPKMATSMSLDNDAFDFSLDILQPAADDLPAKSVTVSREEAEEWVMAYLKRNNRTLSAEQMTELMTGVSKDPRIITMRVLCDIFLTQRSFDTLILPISCSFDTSIAFYVERLKMKFGHDIINAVVRIMTISVRGVSDAEMVDLLSLDENAMKSVNDGARVPYHRFPSHIWYRIRLHLAMLFITLDDGCIRWSNRCIRASMKLMIDKFMTRETHRVLATYFGNLVDPNVRSRMQLLSHPLYRSSSGSVWARHPIFNRRRCTEAAHHMICADMFPEAMAEMCDIEAVCARVRCGLGFFFLSQLVRLDGLFQHSRIEHYTRWLSHSMFKIVADPIIYLVMTCSQQPLISTPRRDMMMLLHTASTNCDFSKEAWIRCIQLGGKQDFGALIDKFEGHHHRVTSVAWSSDGTLLLSGSWDKSICIWNVHAGTLMGVCEGHGAAVTCVSWNPDSLEFASSSWDNTLAIWDVHTGQVVKIFDEHTDFVCCVAWSPNKQYIASGSYDKTIRLWNPTGTNSVFVLEGHDNWVTCLAWSPDSSMLASGSYDHKIMLWAVMYGAWKQTFVVHNGAVLSLSWSLDGKFIASGSVDKLVAVWSVGKGTTECLVHDLPSAVNAVCWHDDSTRMAIGCCDHYVRVWNLKTKSIEGIHESHTDVVSAVCWSHNGSTLVSASADNSICLWDSSSLNKTFVSDCHAGEVLKVVWSPDDRYIASASCDKTVIIWDAQFGKLLSRLSFHSKDVVDVCWSPDCRYLMSTSMDTKAITWDCSSGLPHRVDRCGDKIYFSAVAWSRQATMQAAGSSSGTIRIFNFNTGAVSKSINAHHGGVSCLQFSPVAFTMLASASSDTTVCVWDAQDGVLHHKFNAHKNWVSGISWHPDGHVLASCSLDNHIKLWDVQNEKQIEEFYCHTEPITSVRWNKDGIRIAFSSSDKFIYVWNSTLTHTPPFPLRGHDQDANCLDWNERGTKLVSCSADKTIRVWDAVKLGSTVDREIEILHGAAPT